MRSWLERLENHFIPRSTRVWSVTTASFALGLSFVLSTGPQVQTYVLALINSDNASIYGSAYQRSLIRFPTLFEWLHQASDWRTPFMAAVITVFSLRHLIPRKIAASAFAWSFVVLTSDDLITASVDHQMSLEYALNNVVANAFGGIVVSLLAIAILAGCDFCFEYALGRSLIRRVFGALFAVASGAAISACTFYAAELFYKPNPVQLDVLVGPPVQGYIKAMEQRDEPFALPDGHAPFYLVAGDVKGGEADWLSPDGQLEAQWSSTSSDVPSTASIRLFDGCTDIREYRHIGGSTPPYTLSGISDLKVWFDQGTSNLHVFDDGSVGRFGLKTDSLLSYWMDRGEAKDTIKLTEFVDQDGRLDFLQPLGTTEFFLYAARVKADGTSATSRNRTLHIRSGENEESVDFEGSLEMSSNKKIKCKELPARESLQSGKAAILNSSALVGVLVRIDHHPMSSVYSLEDSKLRASNGSGWITISGLRREDLSWTKSGQVSFLQFSGNIVNLEVDEAHVTPNPAATYMAMGDFDGSYVKSGQLRFLGTAMALFEDRNRINPTKWETLSWDRCAFLLSTIASLLGALAKFIIADLKKNCPSSWLSQ
jgi:hypothetical protein